MAQLVLITGDTPTYEDGDILCAWNNRRISHVHLDDICHVRKIRFNSDGLNDLDTLPEIFQKNTYQYKFERVSRKVVQRTNLITLQVDEISDVPKLVDGKMQHMNVPLFLKRRTLHPGHRIFGVTGAEVWYGGRVDASVAKLNLIWAEVEARTALRKRDHGNHPASPLELRKHLIIPVDDFSDNVSGQLTAPDIDDTDPENPITLKKRKNRVVWRDHLVDLGVLEGDVIDRRKLVDVRGVAALTRSQVVNTKVR